ncbi:hydroxymethylglutaryl-CoA reductase, degradative [Jeotgalibaca dankookensis]|uniref:hydroxymethylglutaryl-CoA reductase, degradative n=1 Tax=Jeotgalibaca dankookensis TaxID=708126 RepID=UPI0009E3833F|nr:hydroxymethylglutaryl-CoA reductase, degradative [Jeotgalibaca dankookensis]
MFMSEKNTGYLAQFYKKSQTERIQALIQAGFLEKEKQDAFDDQLAISLDIANGMIENQIATYQLPFGIATNFLIDGKDYVIPMAIEEPSVIAAASSAAKLVAQYGGFQTAVTDRLMIGQVILTDVPHLSEAIAILHDNEIEIIQAANQAHPSIVKRGGGADGIRIREIAEDLTVGSPSFLIIHLHVETLEAMGANIINTMMEAIIPILENLTNGNALMGILSNYATECLATATCRLPVSALTKNTWTGEEVRDRLILATQVATVDPYRAVTHNKGIMNGIDAIVLASGNDWRAIEAGAHAYASRSGQYRSLSSWRKADNGDLIGELTLPLSIGTVGGSISFHPGAQMAHHLLGNPDAETLEAIIASVGLAQNFSALRALVTEGIQQGHMGLHARSLAISAGASREEIDQVATQLKTVKNMNLATAKEILKNIQKK